MKSTIKLDGLRSVVINKGPDRTARIDLVAMGIGLGSIDLTADQFGALMFAGERVFEAHEMEAQREAGQGA